MARELSAGEAVGLLRATDAISFGLVTSTPVALMKVLSLRDDWRDLTVSGGLLLGTYDVFLHPNVHYRSSFFGAAERHYQAHGADIQFVASLRRCVVLSPLRTVDSTPQAPRHDALGDHARR